MGDNPESGVEDFYERHWPHFVKWWQGDDAHAIHFGMYVKGVHSFVESLHYMNYYAGKLLGITQDKSWVILDAGCGVGGPSTQLAKLFPKSTFIGITITRNQIPLAQELARREGVTNNTQFLLQNYRHTEFPDNYFDGAFAQESHNYAQNKEEMIREMYRVIKPGGRFVILDGFIRDEPLTSLSRKVLDIWRPARGFPDLISMKDLKTLLEKNGFEDVVVEDLTKTILPSVARSTCLGPYFFTASVIKRLLLGKKYRPENDDYFYMGAVVIGDMLGLANIIHFGTVVAVKPKH
jgi:ubiquinone/menaquinone biosynthesis C-methylase UbiE